MIAGALELQIYADMARLQADMEAAKRITGASMGSMDASIKQVQATINAMAEAEKARAGVFERTLAETKRLLEIAKGAADNTAKSLADLKINPDALKIPDEAIASLNSWREKAAYAIGAGAAAGWDKAKTAWEEFKEFTERQIVMWGVAAAVGISAAVLGAVYAAFKAIDFAIGLFTGESYKSANIDALIATNNEVKNLQGSLSLAAVDANALLNALDRLGVPKGDYVAVYESASDAIRKNREELDRLGVRYQDSNGKLIETREFLTGVKSKLEEYTIGWDRNSAAAAIGVGSYEKVVSVLNVTQQEIDKSKDRLDDFNLGIGPETQAAVAEYQKAMREFKNETDLTSNGFKRAIDDSIMPLLTDLSLFFQKGFDPAVKAFRYVIADIISAFYALKTGVFVISESILGSLEAVGLGLGGLASAAWKAVKGDFKGAQDAMTQGWADAKTRLGGIGDNIEAQILHNAKNIRLAWGEEGLGTASAVNVAEKVGKAWKAAAKETKESADEINLAILRSEEMARIYKELHAEIDAIAKANSDYGKAVEAMLGPLESEASALELQATNYGLTRSQIEAVTIARLEEAKAIMIANGASAAAIQFYEREIAARQRISAASANSDELKRQSDFWKSIESTAHQTWTSIADAGKNAWQRLKDTGKNIFFDWLYQMTLKKWMFSFAASASGVGVAQSAFGAQDAGSAGNLLSTGSSAYNLYNGGASGMYSSFATSGVGQSLGLSAIQTPYEALAAGGDTYGALAASNATIAELGGAAGEAAATITGFGASVGAALPWIGGALAVASLLGAFGDSGPVDRSSKYDRSFGSTLDLGIAGSEASGTTHNYKNNFRFSGDEMQASMDAFSASGAASEQNAIKSLALTTEQIAAINEELKKSADIVYGFGTEHTDWTKSQADEQITAVRLQAMATALGKSVAEIAAAMDPAFGALVAAGRQIGLTADELAQLAPSSAAMQSLSANIATYRSAYYSDAERQAEATSAVAAEFAKLGETMPANKQGMHDLLEGLGKTTEEERKTYLGALALSGAFAQVADAQEAAAAATRKTLLDESMASVNTAYSALERAVAAQKSSIDQAYAAQAKASQDSVSASSKVRDNLTTLAGTLASAIDTLTVDTDADLQMRRAAAQATLNDAMTAAQSGQSLEPFADRISAAIAVLGKPAEQLYSSMDDYAYAQGVANGTLSQLKGYAQDQKSVADMTLDAINGAALAAEQQHNSDLARLDQTLLDSKTQIDILNGINASILTIPEALSAMAAALSSLGAERAMQGLNTGKGTSAAAINAAGVNAAYQKYLGTSADAAGMDWQLSHIADGSNTLSQIVDNIANSEAAQAKAINDAYVQYLGTSADAAGLSWQMSHIADGSNSLSQIIDNIRQAGAINGSHANGLARVPFDGYIAELHHNERVLTAQETDDYDRVSALWRSPASSSGSNTARLEALVETLIAKVALLEKPLQNIDDQTSNQLILLDRVTEGGNAMRAEIMNTVTVAA